jgi:hypothetical protein
MTTKTSEEEHTIVDVLLIPEVWVEVKRGIKRHLIGVESSVEASEVTMG